MSTDSTAFAPPPPNFSSGMTPGRLPNVDGRTWAARRYRELVATMGDDLGGELTTAKCAVVCRAAALVTWCEQAEAEFANTGELDIAKFTTATNALRRLLADIGLERQARDLTPSLAEYVRQKYGNGQGAAG